MSRVWGSWPLAELGEFARSERRVREAVQIAVDAGNRVGHVLSLWALGLVELRRGDAAAAAAALEEGLRLTEASGIQGVARHVVASALASACSLLGRIEEALAFYEEADRRYRQIGQVSRVGTVSTTILRVLGPVEAKEHALRALAEFRHRGDRGYEAWTLRLLGEISGHVRPLDAVGAAAYYLAARDLALELGMRPLVAHCHVGLTWLWRATGRLDEARHELAGAKAICRDVGMTVCEEL